MPNPKAAGVASGALSGAAAGSVIPGIGTAVGAVVGAAAGYFSAGGSTPRASIADTANAQWSYRIVRKQKRADRARNRTFTLQKYALISFAILAAVVSFAALWDHD